MAPDLDPPNADSARGLPLLALARAAALLCLGALLDIARGPWTVVAFEEAQNARAGLAFACGHLDAWRALLYRPFCGGCTVDGLLAAPILAALGPVEGAWKLVPAAFSVVAGLGLFALGRGLGGRAGGRVALLLCLGAPWAYRELALTGWGNHAEGLAFPLWALFSLIGSGRAPGLGRGLAAGLLLSFGVYYTASVAWAWPPALLLAAAAGRGALVGLLLGAPLGLLPWGLSQAGTVAPVEVALDRWLQLRPAAPSALFTALVVEPLGPGALWPADRGPPAALGQAAAGLAGLVGLAGAAAAASQGGGGYARLRSLAPLLCILSLTLAFALRHDLWAPEAALHGYAPFTLRYRVAFGPLLAWGAAAGLGAARGAGLGGRLRGLIVGSAVLVGTFGLGWRALAWAGGPAPGLLRPLLLGAQDADPTVPEGQPPTRRAAAQGRRSDLDAARVFAEQHVDPLPRCAALHAGELARRAGLGPLDRPGAPEAIGLLDRAPIPAQPALWAALAAGALRAGAAPVAPDRPAARVWAAPLAPEPRAAALRSLGRAWGESGAALDGEGAEQDDPIDRGWAEGQGRALAPRWTAEGRSWPDPAALGLPDAGLARRPAFVFGLGAGLGEALGCGADAVGAAPTLNAVLAGDPLLQASFDAGVAEGCAAWGRW
jgi:hypothetical protein